MAPPVRSLAMARIGDTSVVKAETELKTLMLASQEGDAAAHHVLLERLSR